MAPQGLMSQSLELMLLGMGTVFVFLTLLVFFTTLMSRALMRLAPESSRPTAQPHASAAGPAGPDERLHAAIVAAIHAHRSKS